MKLDRPRRFAFFFGLLAGALPLWMLPLMAAGGNGFLAYLSVSHTYYAGARQIFGGQLFPAREFGVIPAGPTALILAAALYGAAGAAAGWATAAATMRRHSVIRPAASRDHHEPVNHA